MRRLKPLSADITLMAYPVHDSFKLIPKLALAFLCSAAMHVQVNAQNAIAGKTEILDAPSVRAWLSRIDEAAAHTNYQGTFVVSAGGTVSSARILHVCEGANQIESIENLDGVARRVIRFNDEVQTLWPQQNLLARASIPRPHVSWRVNRDW